MLLVMFVKRKEKESCQVFKEVEICLKIIDTKKSAATYRCSGKKKLPLPKLNK
jgi:hypothetical protein